MRYLLDTNILIAISKHRPGPAERLQELPVLSILLSSVVLAEIEYGIVKSAKPDLNRQVFDSIVKAFEMVDFGAAAAKHYGEIRVDLERRGQIIGPNDLMIAAQALAANAVLVTDNTAEFLRVRGLVLENWLDR